MLCLSLTYEVDKVIIATGELPTLRDVYKTSLVCMFAGADFIKTSTGKEKLNAQLSVVRRVQCVACCDF